MTRRSEITKWIKGCGVAAVVFLLALSGGVWLGFPYYQKWMDRKLVMAVQDGRVNETRRWVKRGASVSAQDDYTGCTVLDLAVQNDDPLMVRLLINAGAPVNVIDDVNCYPISRASSVLIAKLLVEKGAEWKKDESQLILTATEGGDHLLLEYYLSLGADPNPRDDRNYTPLDIAVGSGFLACCHALIDAGADVNASKDYSPLYIAASSEYVQMTSMLLDAGAEVEFTAQDGSTLLEVAGPKCRALLEAHVKKLAKPKTDEP